MNDFKERYNEFFDDLKGRIRNPLILSFILIWSYFHWSLIYKILTINNAIPVDSRLSAFTKYISDKGGWKGMIGKPLLWSFISLAVYYLIAIAAQSIKIFLGKRFNAFVLAKFDTGSFAFKTELKEEKNHLKRVRKELDETKISLNIVAVERDNLQEKLQTVEKDLSRKAHELDLVEKNVLNNKKFQERFEKLLVFFLADYKSIDKANVKSPDNHDNYYKVFNGNWSIFTNNNYAKDVGSIVNVRVVNDNIYDTSDKRYGSITFFRFDREYRILSFTLQKVEGETSKYVLMEITPDEFLGFCNNLHCHIRRHE